jgi:hypothetical protein
MVAGTGIEPVTRGFSIAVADNLYSNSNAYSLVVNGVQQNVQ